MNIGIAGAGLVGRLLAWQLLRRGHQVTLFDADRRGGDGCAAFVAAAMLAPLSEAVGCDIESYRWGADAVSQWQNLLEQLREDSTAEIMLRGSGSIAVAHELDRSNLQHFEQQLRSKLPQAMGDVKTLERDDLQELEPELLPLFQRGLWLQSEGCLDNHALLDALAEAIDTRGGQWHEQCAVQSVSAGRIVSARGEDSFDLTVDARGFGARSQWPQLRGVRGEVLWVSAPEVNLSRPIRLMHPRYKLYISPKPDSVYVVGATEIESESEAPVTVRSQLELLSALYSLHRGFAEAKLLGSYARCRPALPDNMPKVLRSPGLLRINGLYRHGYLLGPSLLDAALQALDGGEHPWIETSDEIDTGQRQQRA